MTITTIGDKGHLKIIFNFFSRVSRLRGSDQFEDIWPTLAIYSTCYSSARHLLLAATSHFLTFTCLDPFFLSQLPQISSDNSQHCSPVCHRSTKTKVFIITIRIHQNVVNWLESPIFIYVLVYTYTCAKRNLR